INDYIISTFTTGFNAITDRGDLRAFDAVSLGQGEGLGVNNKVAIAAYAQLGALKGSVGMIRSTGTSDGADITYFNFLGRGAFTTLPSIIGGDVQYIVSPTDLFTDLECNGSIGVVQANNFGARNAPGSLSANVDGLGKPGTIDLIDVTGDLGSLQGGGPTLSTNVGGNVRYIHISDASTAYRPFLFGGSQPEQTTFVQGQQANLTDDS